MSTLDRRLTALEQLAEDVRRGVWHDLVLSLPEARNLTPAELEAAVDEAVRVQAQIDDWRRAGVREREIVQRQAAEMGLTGNELEAECERIIWAPR
jgi:hypothetical protein